MREGRVGISIYNLYLGGAAHADDVRTVATSVKAAEEQSVQVSKFASHQGLTLNKSKTEVVKFSSNTIPRAESINLVGSPIAVIPGGYTWNRFLSAKPAVKDNTARARRQFFALGSTGCYLGHSNPLTAISVVESCIFPTLLYGAENWILNEEAIKLLENFQAEIGRRILRLSKRHSQLSVLLAIALSWPSMKARVLSQASSAAFYPQKVIQ